MIPNLKGMRIPHASRFYYAENCEIYLQTVRIDLLYKLSTFTYKFNRFLQKTSYFHL